MRAKLAERIDVAHALMRRMTSRATEYHVQRGDSALLEEAVEMMGELIHELRAAPTEGAER